VSGSDSSVISENVAKHLGLKIVRKNVHALNGVAASKDGSANDFQILQYCGFGVELR
ncbi:18448_t:CDS:1, partial [Rhizophagus irregularis]